MTMQIIKFPMKFDNCCLLNQTVSTAVTISGEVSESICVAVCDSLATKCLAQRY